LQKFFLKLRYLRIIKFSVVGAKPFYLQQATTAIMHCCHHCLAQVSSDEELVLWRAQAKIELQALRSDRTVAILSSNKYIELATGPLRQTPERYLNWRSKLLTLTACSANTTNCEGFPQTIFLLDGEK